MTYCLPSKGCFDFCRVSHPLFVLRRLPSPVPFRWFPPSRDSCQFLSREDNLACLTCANLVLCSFSFGMLLERLQFEKKKKINGVLCRGDTLKHIQPLARWPVGSPVCRSPGRALGEGPCQSGWPAWLLVTSSMSLRGLCESEIRTDQSCWG